MKLSQSNDGMKGLTEQAAEDDPLPPLLVY